MEHQDTKLTSRRPRLKELNDNPYIGCDVCEDEQYEDLKACNYSAFSWKPDNCMP